MVVSARRHVRHTRALRAAVCLFALCGAGRLRASPGAGRERASHWAWQRPVAAHPPLRGAAAPRKNIRAGLPRLSLRGGGAAEGAAEFFSEDPRPSGPVRHLVPKEYESLAECIYDVRCGDTVFLQGLPHAYRTFEGGEWGWHSWMGQLYVTNECLWRSRKKGFPHSGATTMEELRAFYREADKAGKGLIRLEQTVIRGAGELFFAGAPGVKVSGQLVLCENTTGAFQGPMTLALFSDINFLDDQVRARSRAPAHVRSSLSLSLSVNLSVFFFSLSLSLTHSLSLCQSVNLSLSFCGRVRESESEGAREGGGGEGRGGERCNKRYSGRKQCDGGSWARSLGAVR